MGKSAIKPLLQLDHKIKHYICYGWPLLSYLKVKAWTESYCGHFFLAMPQKGSIKENPKGKYFQPLTSVWEEIARLPKRLSLPLEVQDLVIIRIKGKER